MKYPEYNGAVSRGIISAIAVAVFGCSPTPPDTSTTPIDFAQQIKPLLEENCLICHHSETLLGGLSVQSRSAAFGKSDRGSYIVPGDPDASLIYSMTGQRHGKQDEIMPADGILLSDEQRELLRRWIEEGAHWPEGKEGILVPLKVQPGEA